MNVLYPRCAGLDVHKDTVVAAVRIAADGPANTEVRTFDTTTPGLLALSGWLAECGCTHVAMEATGIYWKPVWHILSDGDLTLILANAAHVKNVPGRKTDVADAAWLGEHGCTHVAMEATGIYWKPVWHILSDGDFTLILANAAHVKNVPGRKTDVADVIWLADLLAHGLIRASFVPPPATQELRALLRTRKQLVREQASHVQRLQKTLETPISSSPRC